MIRSHRHGCAGARLAAALVALALVGGASGEARAASVVLDTFDTLDGWTTAASEGAEVRISTAPGPSGNAMRIDYDLSRGRGYVILRKAFPLELPSNYAISFKLRGEGLHNDFELKLVDPTGQRVWWRKQRDYSFPVEWQRVVVRRSRLEFAWGTTNADLTQLGSLELAIVASDGGKGTVWIDDLAFEKREPTAAERPAPSVSPSSFREGFEGAKLLDGALDTAWKSKPLPREQQVTIDFGTNLEYGGLILDWDRDDYATTYQIETSSDGNEWTPAFRTTTGDGGRVYVYMPDAESRFLRVAMQRSSRARGYGIRELAVQPYSFSASPNQFFEAIAAEAPAGTYPRYFQGKQTYWTVIGVPEDSKEALLNTDGMLELGRGELSIEPILRTDSGPITWAQADLTQTLADGYLPIPSVTWRTADLTLTVTAVAAGEAGHAVLYARYRVENHGADDAPLALFLAMRPFQVLPPWQNLNMSGGVAHVQEVRFEGTAAHINGNVVMPLTPPDRFGAASFEQGTITRYVLAGEIPAQPTAYDPFGLASAAYQYNLYLAPGTSTEVDVAVPFDPKADGRDVAARGFDQALAQTADRWRRLLDRVQLDVPESAREDANAAKSTLAYLLINRDGPAIQPGSRTYQRSWIRDGAISSAALLRAGFTEEVRSFLRWYASFQAPDGMIPCCVDRRGADLTAEHDSAGAFIHTLADYYRFTRDVGFVFELWPNVIRAVDYMANLRATQMTDAFRTPDKIDRFGLLPESISHEGYSAHAVHSYWDDFFALRGLSDAAELAPVLGDDQSALRFGELRDSFRETLLASIHHTVERQSLAYLPGSVELGDFDPTSTAIALVLDLDLGDEVGALIGRTLDRYVSEVRHRFSTGDWDAFSPYELRNVAALTRLGRRADATALLDQLLRYRRPIAWNEWAEIVWRDADAPRFIGDMPHTWVGAGYANALRDLFAYERGADRALVLGAGLPPEWVSSDGGIDVRRMPTFYGPLSYSMKAESANRVRVRIQPTVSMPPGKIVVASPLDRPIRGVEARRPGVRAVENDRLVIDQLPADFVVTF